MFKRIPAHVITTLALLTSTVFSSDQNVAQEVLNPLLQMDAVTNQIESITLEGTTQTTKTATESIAVIPTEVPLHLNGHFLYGLTEGISIENIKSNRKQILDTQILLIDSIFHRFLKITLNLSDIPYENDEERRASFTYALGQCSENNDPAAMVIALEQNHFYTTLQSVFKPSLMNYVGILQPEPIDRNETLYKLATKHKSTIAALHYWNAHASKVSVEQEKRDALALAGSVPFEYLEAYMVYNDQDLNLNETIEKLNKLNTSAGFDFASIQTYGILCGDYGYDPDMSHEDLMKELKDEWKDLITQTATRPLGSKLAAKPANKHLNSEVFPPGYKAGLYLAAGLEETHTLLDVYKALAENLKSLPFAEVYFDEFIKQNPTIIPAEQIKEINRLSIFVPTIKHILADNIMHLSDNGLFGYFDLTPAERLEELQKLSNEGIQEAANYLALAYATSFGSEKTIAERYEEVKILMESGKIKPVTYNEYAKIFYSERETDLANHLGIPTRQSLQAQIDLENQSRSESEHLNLTFGDIKDAHQNVVKKLLIMGLEGNRDAQTLLFGFKINGFTLIDKLFDDQCATVETGTPFLREMKLLVKEFVAHSFIITNILCGTNEIQNEFNKDYVG